MTAPDLASLARRAPSIRSSADPDDVDAAISPGYLPHAVARDLDDADEKEVAFRLRVEPGVQGSSEVFLISNQRELGSSEEPEWPKVSEEPALDAAVLEQLQISLAASSERGGSVSLLAGRTFDAPGRVVNRASRQECPKCVSSMYPIVRASRRTGAPVE